MKLDFFILITLLLWGAIPIMDKLGLSHETASPEAGLIIRLLAAALVLAIAVPFSASLKQSIASISWKGVFIFALSGVISMIIAQYFYYSALKEKDVAKWFPILFGGAPVVTIVLGWCFLGEAVTTVHWLGCGLIVFGSALLFR